MTRRRWIADEISGNTAALVGEHAVHLARVLRVQVGQEFDIATGKGVREGRIASISEDRVEFELGAELASKLAPSVTLLLAIFKFDRMEWAIEKCTELGVSRIIPLIARRTDSHLEAASAKRHERWQRIAIQASEQSRRAVPAEIAKPIKQKELSSAGVLPVSEAPKNSNAKKIVLAESDADTRLRDALLVGASGAASEVVLAVGPEGGWTEEEMQWFRKEGWSAASLGDTILRAETAAIVATALTMDVLG